VVRLIALTSLLVLSIPIAFLIYADDPYTIPSAGSGRNLSKQCAQVDPLRPTVKNDKLEDMERILASDGFRNQSIKYLSHAVQIETQSYDDMGKIGDDKRWDTMFTFAKYLQDTFPSVHKALNLETVNVHGLIYTWEGSDASLKPTLLMAHQDVVPVPDSTVDAWTHPPFSGFYDGKYIWGRGSSDCKNQLIAIMEAIELLVSADFSPKRTVVLSFGFDEEISGREGAGRLAPFLHDRYGDDGIAAIVDEGANFEKVWGTVFAKPGVGEKGYTDITVTVRMPGGHSSIPSDHTSIGVISELITMIEANPFSMRLDEENPYLGQLHCGAEHAPDFPSKLKRLLSHRSRKSKARTCKAKSDHLALEAAKAGPAIKYLMQTSQAVDVIGGGVKVNALPERTSAIINHRINIGETPKDAAKHVEHFAKMVAEKYNLTLHAYDGVKEAPLSISLSMSDTTLDVAPVTPTNVDKETAYKILSGTTRALYGEDLVVTPAIMTGNTDTR